MLTSDGGTPSQTYPTPKFNVSVRHVQSARAGTLTVGIEIAASEPLLGQKPDVDRIVITTLAAKELIKKLVDALIAD